MTHYEEVKQRFDEIKKSAYINQQTWLWNPQEGSLEVIEEVGIRDHFDKDLFEV